MKKLGVLFAAILMMVSFTAIKAQKIAHADVAGILDALPEMQKAQKELEEFSKVKQNEIQKMSEALQKKVEDYRKAGQPDAAKEAAFQKENDQIQQMAEAAQKDLLDKQNTLFAPIDQKLRDAVDAVGKEKGYEYILDGNSQAIIFRNGPDATDDIKKKLGL